MFSGGITRKMYSEIRKMYSIQLIDKAVKSEARQKEANRIMGITERTLQHWKKKPDKKDLRNLVRVVRFWDFPSILAVGEI